MNESRSRPASGFSGGVLDLSIHMAARLEPMPFAAARTIISRERGHQFEPAVVDAFLSGFEELWAIAERHGESEPTLTASH